MVPQKGLQMESMRSYFLSNHLYTISQSIFLFEYRENSLPIVAPSFKLDEGPLFRLIVTGPEASIQVISKGVPAAIPVKSELLNFAAETSEAVRAKRKTLDCIVIS